MKRNQQSNKPQSRPQQHEQNEVKMKHDRNKPHQNKPFGPKVKQTKSRNQ